MKRLSFIVLIAFFISNISLAQQATTVAKRQTVAA
ncbi:hypothetical protein MNBD_BACTEROID06-1801, partial [hydrothermal vent metagenome]